MRFLILVLVALCFTSKSLAKKGFGPGEQEWGYVTVRPNANMFWWLYYTTANVQSYYEKPLVIWLQGGPGASSTAYGNFEELGPLDVDLKPRNYTWVKDYNVLFIDNPVGTGYSYTTSLSAFATTNAQIANDLLECMKGFIKELPQFSNVPTYITTESYGGKMGAEFALTWYKAQQAGSIQSNLKGVALGDAWISPIDSVMTWAPFLHATGMIDRAGYEKIDQVAQMTKQAVERGTWKTATVLWANTENAIYDVTGNIDFYNILTKMTSTNTRILNIEKLLMSIRKLMNGPVKEDLDLPVDHGRQSNTVFANLAEDFMKPVIDKVEQLLNQTDLKVVVLTGHMDLIVDTPGTINWVEKLKWKNVTAWNNARRVPLVVNNIIEGYSKSQGNFALYWVNRAGHMVPKDNPNGMAQILKDFAN
ncbi:retinoid-inducible serine carboxypeptidase-like isoform X2 [Osmia bicornis bicornis]|uniref:retinoid-inducible serine carboxypeptidase-like isoform X2 n=1 Tax=Osmia bicornis bicornis TaxID=1437191 RepID=UPI0010F48FE7|nr:retinoid-inducible serine carboxypeptidase-like isoform X2 [Osmia bicornis bicornis]